MSNIYINEPVTSGKAIIKTTHGEIEVELWCKECPLACRNFLQLALENHYEATEFQVLKRYRDLFILFGPSQEYEEEGNQTIYEDGMPFKDEVHTRLTFSRRGLLVMAKEKKEDKNMNRTKFFITLSDVNTSYSFASYFSPSNNISYSYTIFGKVVGPTIYNVLKMGLNQEEEEKEKEFFRNLSEEKRQSLVFADENNEGEVSEKVLIKDVEVINSYFTDLKPRLIKKKKEVEQVSDKQKEKESHREKFLKVKATKNSNLLSFEENNDDEEEDVIQVKFKASHDRKRSKNESRGISSSSKSYEDDESEDEINKEKLKKKSTSQSTFSSNNINDEEPDQNFQNLLEEQEQKRREELLLKSEAEFLALRQKLSAMKNVPSEKKEVKKMLSPLEQRRAKYLNKTKDLAKEDRSEDTFSKFLSFSSTLSSKINSKEREVEAYHGQILEGDDKKQEDLSDWLSGTLKFKKHIDDSYRNKKEDDDYTMEEVSKDKRNYSRNNERERGRERGRSNDRRQYSI